MSNRKTHLLMLLAFSPFLADAQSNAKEVFSDISPADVTAAKKENMPDKWTFSDCMEYAIANSTDVRRALLSILQADENVGSAKDAWLPTVGFSTNQNFTNYPVSTEGRTSNVYGSSYNVNAAWTVWEGNVRKYRLESAKLQRRQQQLAGDDAVKEITLGVLSAYLNIMYAQETVSIAKQTLEVSTSQTNRARRLMESGRTSKVDYAQIESQMAQDQYNLVQAESNLSTAKMNMKKILNLGLDYNFEISEPTLADSEISALLPSKQETYNLAAAWLPGIKSNEISKDVYANDIKIAKAGNLPNIALQGGVGTGYTSGGNSWGWQMGHGLNENVGVSVSVPIYDGNSTRRAVAKAKLAALDYDITREELLNNLSQTIENLYIDADNAKAKYASGTKQLEATQMTADLVNRQFELGLVNPLELLTAHNNLLNARLELLQSKFMAILSNKTISYYATSNVTL
ncbi:MAG: TolC family protein [Muribaculaceae bacterium]|nr:TolC family protein [Muribaculaceae bacterium]MDE6795260.1 TolC family protein [Muribaculaceae bacterium]